MGCPGHWILVIGYYLEFEIWLLEFRRSEDGSDLRGYQESILVINYLRS